MLIRKLGFGLIGLALIVNIGTKVAQHYQNKQEVITTSEFSYNITNFQEYKGNFYKNVEYASYALGLSGAALALAGKRIKRFCNRYKIVRNCNRKSDGLEND